MNKEDTLYDNIINSWADLVSKGELDQALGQLNKYPFWLKHEKDDMIVRTYDEVREYAEANTDWDLYDRCEEQLAHWTDNAQAEALQDLTTA